MVLDKRKLYKLKKEKAGFTLIELMLVMAIIFILVGFMVPKFKGYKDKAEKLKAINDGRQIYIAAMESYSENDCEFNKDELINSVLDLAGIQIEDSKISVEDTDKQKVEITFNEGSEEHTIYINADDCNYKIDENGKDEK